MLRYAKLNSKPIRRQSCWG